MKNTMALKKSNNTHVLLLRYIGIMGLKSSAIPPKINVQTVNLDM
jgi:hypothetical protein